MLKVCNLTSLGRKIYEKRSHVTELFTGFNSYSDLPLFHEKEQFTDKNLL